MTRSSILSLLLLTAALASGAHAEITCSVSTSVWNNGYVANMTVTNTGAELEDGWSVDLLFNQPPQINNYWSATLTTSGSVVTAGPLSWNAQLYPGQSTSFGFVGSHSGNFVDPVCKTASDSPLEEYLKEGVATLLEYRSAGASSSSGSSSGGFSSSSSSSSSSASSASSSSGGAPVDTGDDITNTQEAGVDEADIIESDGTHLFVVRGTSGSSYYSSSSSTSTSSSTTSASSTSGGGSYTTHASVTLDAYLTDAVTGSASKLSTLTIDYDESLLSLAGAYLRQTSAGKRLTTVGQTSERQLSYWTYSYYDYYPYYQVSNGVTISIADVDDANAMTEVQRLQFDGALVSSRRIGNELFVVSRYSPNLSRLGFDLSSYNASGNEAILEGASLSDLLPHIYDGNGGSRPMIAETDCTLPEWPERVNAYAGSLVVLTKINLDDTSQMKSRCLATSATDIYASQDAIYAFGYGYSSGMKIHKFAVADDMPYAGNLRLNGSVPCSPKSYCFGEKDGILRVLYSAYNSTSETPYRLATIVESDTSQTLEVLATLPNSARPEPIGKPGDRIYGMRSFGDYSYVVTFAKVDPLYALDLTNPADPYIAGALEVTGFSQYLHPVGDNLLIGIGKDAYYDEARNITWYQGIKVELFDISEPTMLRSLGSEIIGRRGSQTTVISDPRAFAFRDDEYGMRFSLPIQVNDRLPTNGDPSEPNQTYSWSHTGLYVFGIETDANGEATLTRQGVLKAEEYGTTSYTSSINYDRGVLDDGSVFYLHNYNMFSSLLGGLETE